MTHERVVFLADAHLQPGIRPEQTGVLRQFLEQVCVAGTTLVLLGDLFHCWFERSGKLVGDFTEVLDLFSAAAGRGVDIHYVTGNRDFAVGAGNGDDNSGWIANTRFPGFYKIVGNETESVLTRYGIKPHGVYFYLSAQNLNLSCLHGDVFCTGEPAYLFLRWLTQGPLGRISMALGPFWLARLIVGWFQNRPVSLIKHYPANGRGISWERACGELASGADILFCGHLHHAGQLPLINGERKGQLVLTGPWCAGHEYSLLEAGKVRFMTFNM